jgi:predicted nucleotidyltransferase
MPPRLAPPYRFLIDERFGLNDVPSAMIEALEEGKQGIRIASSSSPERAPARASVLSSRAMSLPANNAADADATLRPIGDALAPIAPIQVAYLFGSRARGTARPDSDLDIAVAFPRDLADTERGRIKLQIIDDLTAALGALGERTDIVDLDRAGSAVAFAAISTGRCIFVRDRADRVRLEARIARRYDDERPYRELMRAAALRAAEKMRTGSHG